MKLTLVWTITFAVVLSQSIASADKAAAIEQFLNTQDSQSADRWDGFIKGSARDFVGSDQRLRDTREAKIDSLVKSVDRTQLRKKMKELLDREFTEEEIKYLISMMTSGIGKKWGQFGPRVFKEMKAIAETQMKENYEKATGVKWDPKIEQAADRNQSGLSPLPRVRAGTAKPNWATKLVWGMFPDQKNACGVE